MSAQMPKPIDSITELEDRLALWCQFREPLPLVKYASVRELLTASLYYIREQRASHDALTAQNAKLSTLLDSLRNNIDAGLLTALRNGGQLDMDGCEVRVSRQACEEAADHLEQFAALKQAQP